MVFNATATKDGIIQTIEFWTRMEDAAISGNATLLLQMTGRVNAGFDTLMPLLLSFTDKIRWDDINHTDRPIGTVNIVSGQADYSFAEDGTDVSDGGPLDILNITDVRILQSSTDTEYKTLEKLTLNDEKALDAMSPNPSVSGKPTHYLEVNNTIYLYPEPDYSATSGLKIFFEREQHYFLSTDTTAEAGIPKPFHELLALYPALDWNVVNRPTDTGLINELKLRIARKENEIRDMISLKAPTRNRLKVNNDSNR